MRKKRQIIFLFLISFFGGVLHAQIEYAKQMASTIMDQYKDSMVMKKFANHLEQDNQIKAGQTIEEAQKSLPAHWAYELGVALMGFERLWKYTGDTSYILYTKHI